MSENQFLKLDFLQYLPTYLLLYYNIVRDKLLLSVYRFYALQYSQFTTRIVISDIKTSIKNKHHKNK